MTHCFPTRRSSDLLGQVGQATGGKCFDLRDTLSPCELRQQLPHQSGGDRRRVMQHPLIRFRLPSRDIRQGRLDRLECGADPALDALLRSEEHTSELQPLMRISYAVFCLKKKKC